MQIICLTKLMCVAMLVSVAECLWSHKGGSTHVEEPSVGRRPSVVDVCGDNLATQLFAQ